MAVSGVLMTCGSVSPHPMMAGVAAMAAMDLMAVRRSMGVENRGSDDSLGLDFLDDMISPRLEPGLNLMGWGVSVKG